MSERQLCRSRLPLLSQWRYACGIVNGAIAKRVFNGLVKCIAPEQQQQNTANGNSQGIETAKPRKKMNVASSSQFPCNLFKNAFKHVGCQTTGVRVVAGTMIAIDQDTIMADISHGTMTKRCVFEF